MHTHVYAVDRLMLDGLRHWPWPPVAPLRRIVEGQLRAPGKRLRPRLAFAIAEAVGGDPAEVVAAAASVELYHVASLVLDDVQDNARVRRGAPTVHASASMSVAINVAAVIRSLSYHMIHRCPDYDVPTRALLHRELDEAATRLVLGQGADIGWNAGWYASRAAFPYAQMVEWKTGALFGCAAAMGALIAGAGPDRVDEARRFGVSFGMLYQMADDYLDVFGDERELGRPRGEDIRTGKLSAPVLLLPDEVDLSHVDDPMLVLDRYAVAERLRATLAKRAADLVRPPGSALDGLVTAVLAKLQPS